MRSVVPPPIAATPRAGFVEPNAPGTTSSTSRAQADAVSFAAGAAERERRDPACTADREPAGDRGAEPPSFARRPPTTICDRDAVDHRREFAGERDRADQERDRDRVEPARAARLGLREPERGPADPRQIGDRRQAPRNAALVIDARRRGEDPGGDRGELTCAGAPRPQRDADREPRDVQHEQQIERRAARSRATGWIRGAVAGSAYSGTPSSSLPTSAETSPRGLLGGGEPRRRDAYVIIDVVPRLAGDHAHVDRERRDHEREDDHDRFTARTRPRPVDTRALARRNHGMRRFVLAVLLVGLAACHSTPSAPPCEAVAGQFFLLATGELDKATVDPATQRAVADQLPAMRDALKDACKDGAWSADVRTCMLAARDHAAIQACEQKLTDDQRAALSKPAAR